MLSLSVWFSIDLLVIVMTAVSTRILVFAIICLAFVGLAVSNPCWFRVQFLLDEGPCGWGRMYDGSLSRNAMAETPIIVRADVAGAATATDSLNVHAAVAQQYRGMCRDQKCLDERHRY